ncbi:hypothetical protein AWB68_02998 [Caballeronia choica]|uniref:Uncharacterized protein n=1 Tax=Caballeronia choica TaxID=326476 RepID=A0A158IUA6_9BURK|nr:hypothetical protein [Caballeronia choica]SAL59621.1 hypothetical protein AWB68_02998 [Caballeronia choica]
MRYDYKLHHIDATAREGHGAYFADAYVDKFPSTFDKVRGICELVDASLIGFETPDQAVVFALNCGVAWIDHNADRSTIAVDTLQPAGLRARRRAKRQST